MGDQGLGLADSANGYLLKCDIYKGKKEIRQQDRLLGEEVVLQLTENFWGKWHHTVKPVLNGPCIKRNLS